MSASRVNVAALRGKVTRALARDFRDEWEAALVWLKAEAVALGMRLRMGEHDAAEILSAADSLAEAERWARVLVGDRRPDEWHRRAFAGDEWGRRLHEVALRFSRLMRAEEPTEAALRALAELAKDAPDVLVETEEAA